MEFKHYRSVHGRAVQRFGTDTFIGCTRSPTGFLWNERPVAIPLDEVRRNLRSYRNAVARGDLVDITDEVVSKKSARRAVAEVDDATLAGPKDQESDETPAPKRGGGRRRRNK